MNLPFRIDFLSLLYMPTHICMHILYCTHKIYIFWFFVFLLKFFKFSLNSSETFRNAVNRWLLSIRNFQRNIFKFYREKKTTEISLNQFIYFYFNLLTNTALWISRHVISEASLISQCSLFFVFIIIIQLI